jgi:hypothetical protein
MRGVQAWHSPKTGVRPISPRSAHHSNRRQRGGSQNRTAHKPSAAAASASSDSLQFPSSPPRLPSPLRPADVLPCLLVRRPCLSSISTRDYRLRSWTTDKASRFPSCGELDHAFTQVHARIGPGCCCFDSPITISLVGNNNSRWASC